ncbi:hypothetical protein B0A64_00875 [Flavobacterium araucananum]|uniref:Uncharacterized protein n=1 Tax=Flavobacterium araucananum TaxID=946678 RepID=A0A227PHH3_9FLAO|nr:hypothetical protein B0A64_00875 [Flavobacterium araucananum]
MGKIKKLKKKSQTPIKEFGIFLSIPSNPASKFRDQNEVGILSIEIQNLYFFTIFIVFTLPSAFTFKK